MGERRRWHLGFFPGRGRPDRSDRTAREARGDVWTGGPDVMWAVLNCGVWVESGGPSSREHKCLPVITTAVRSPSPPPPAIWATGAQ
ncbi:hypothetical protein E2562_020629 [Oryza meyeriana var. granulata]|uniref:Uncharacterized protein n=1 Tax=Oryza meyeriana var. granulata TaxID=110450 RepID=A0A6G1DYM9_9ORYZ|nr:hypothetical protein E2562_020629 [Oryza meyeriana var. granulata]